uniref:BTB domain-containing protein n=1 Tax=Arundo donax TaxID=35708 RepID=A0A0A8XX45_ARUDO
MSSESKKTASRCSTVAETGTHTFEIVGYSLKKGIGVGKFVRSGTFAVGGYDWAIRFYPDGESQASQEFVAIFLELVSINAEVRATYELRLVTHAPVSSGFKFWSPKVPRLFKSCDHTRFGPRNPRFILRTELEQESSAYICGDRLTIECDVTVIRESQLLEGSEIDVPPSDITEHLGKLMKGKVGADVTFSVGGETFTAHTVMLAARSPVFKAQFYGQMSETYTHLVTIKNIQPAVFGALLHFVYTDSLPDMDDLEKDDYIEMIQQLLVAADRYAMDRLMLICQSIIRKNLNVETVATTLALADRHNCDRLKAACAEFIISSNELGTVVASQGYANLKRSCPSVFIDLFEKASKQASQNIGEQLIQN